MRIFTSLLSGFFGLFFLAQISTAKPVPVEHYSRLPATFDAAISPDGNWLALVTDNEGEYILRVINLGDPSDEKTRAATYPNSVKINWVHWANNQQLLMSTRQAEKIRGVVVYTGYLFAIDRDVQESQLLLKPGIKGGAQGDFRQFNNKVIDFLPNDPDHILMAYGRKKSFEVGVHKVNVKTRGKKRVERGLGDIQSWRTDRRGEVRIGQGRTDRSSAWRLKIRDADSDKWREADEYPGLDNDVSVYGFTDNPDELIIGDYKDKDTVGLYIYDLVQKKQTRKLFHNDRYDVDNIIISPDGTKVIGATYLADTKKREFFDPEYKARISQIEQKLPGYQINLIEETADGHKALFKAVTASVPPLLFVFDFKEDRAKLVALDYPEIGKTIQARVSKVTYPARDGYEIPGYVTTPPKITDGIMPFKNQPFIVMPHGGPYARDTASFDYLAQFMASRGYSVLQMNFRGSDGYGDSHKQAGRKNWEVMQEDVEDGTRWLIEKGYADPKRICIVGWSYGGYASLMGAITDPELYACAASIAGVTDLKDMVADLKKYRFGENTAKNFILKGFKDEDAIAQNSPVKRAKEITTPIFMAHGKQDVNVHFDQFVRMKGALKKSKTKTTFLQFKNEDHYFINFENRSKLLKGLDKFLADNLGESEAAP